MENVNGVLEKDVTKKKKRRKRRSSAKTNNVATVKNETKKVEVVKEEKKVENKEPKQPVIDIDNKVKKVDTSKNEEGVTYNTFEIEKLKADITDRLSYRTVPMNMFTIKNLLATVFLVCLLTLFVVGGYYIGLFNYEAKLNENDYNESHKVTGMGSVVDYSGYRFYVPFGFENVENTSTVKIIDTLDGTTIELLNISLGKVEFDSTNIELFRSNLENDGYVVLSSYVLDNGMLVYSAVDPIFANVKVVYVENDNIIYKLLIGNEYAEINGDIYDYVDEFIGR